MAGKPRRGQHLPELYGGGIDRADATTRPSARHQSRDGGEDAARYIESAHQGTEQDAKGCRHRPAQRPTQCGQGCAQGCLSSDTWW